MPDLFVPELAQRSGQYQKADVSRGTENIADLQLDTGPDADPARSDSAHLC
jgi:hypothetical protein